MESNNKVKNVILAVLVVGLVGMTIAYAALTQQLLITDNQVTVSSKWRIRFAANPTSTAGAGTTASVETAATTDDDFQTIKGLRATLVKPGDYVEVAFTVQNEGNIAAKGATTAINLGALTCTNGTGSTLTEEQLSTFCGKLEYYVRHSDRTTNWTSADTLAAAASGQSVGGTIDGILRIGIPSTLEASDFAAVNNNSVVVTLGDTTLHFEQQ